MDVETILKFLEQSIQEISAGGPDNEWAAGYVQGLFRMREFILEEAGNNGEAQASTTIDLLNDVPFLEITHRALNLCAVAEAVLSRLPTDDAHALSDAASQFRSWFAPKST
jgi:hypothetical protein